MFKKAIIAAALFLAACSGIPNSTPMPEGQLSLPPVQWEQFCQEHPEEITCQ